MSKKWEMPAPDEILNAIDEWRSLNLISASKEEVSKRFSGIFSDMLKVFVGESSTGGYSTFYRIRKFEYLIDNVDELWAPKPEPVLTKLKKIKRGRCNFENEPVLYVSTDGANCFEELNVQLGQHAYLIRYKKQLGELRLRSAYGTDWESIGLGEQIFETKTDNLSYKILCEFLRSEFMKPTCRKCDGSDFVYDVTASIIAYLKSHLNVDGFIYPSAVNVFSNNVALFPEYEKQKLELQDVRIVKLGSNDADGVSYETLFNGIIDGGKVSWKPCSGSGGFRRMTARYMGK